MASSNTLLAIDETSQLACAAMLCARVGVPFDASAASEALSASSETDAIWGALLDLGPALNLLVRASHGTLDELAEMVRPDMPAVLRDQEGELLLLDTVLGGRARVTRHDRGPRWLSQKQLAAMLGPADPAGNYPFLLAEPLAPATALLGVGGDSPAGPFDRLWSVLRAEREDLRVVLVYALGVGLLSLGTPLAVQVLINTVAFGALRQPLVVLSLLLGATLAFGAILRALQRVVVEVLQRRIFVRMVADLAFRLPRVQVDALERSRGPEIVNRFFDVITVQKAVSSLLLDGLAAALQAFVGLTLLALYHPLLLAFDILLLISIAVLLFGLGGKGPSTAIYESKAKYAVVAWLEELATHSRSFRLPGGYAWASRQADLLAHAYLSAREGHFRVYFRQYAGVLGLQVLAGTVLLAGGGWLVLERQLTLGQLVAAELIVATALAGVAKLSEKLEGFYDLLAALDKLGQLVELPLERGGGRALADAVGPAALELEHLALRADLQLDLSLEAGDRVAVLGDEGSGKSKLAELLIGLRTPQHGAILLDGQNLQSLRLSELRAAVHVVSQAEILDSSLRRNLIMDRSDISPSEQEAALRALGLYEAVGALPQGDETPLGDDGAPLSELQSLRLTLARAWLAKPRLLVLDGVLDRFPPAEREALLDSLSARERPWTLLVFTRDPELAESMPLTVHLSDGRLRRASPWRKPRS